MHQDTLAFHMLGNAVIWDESDELVHIEDTLLSESLAFPANHLLKDRDLERDAHLDEDYAFQGKRCLRCGEMKSYIAFTRDPSRKDGFCPYCRLCRSILRRKPILERVIPAPQIHVVDGCDCPGKECSTCNQIKCHGAFYHDKRAKSGLRSNCRLCSIASNIACNHANKDRYYAKKKVYVKKQGELHREKRKALYRKYREENPDYQQIWAKKNPERVTSYRVARRARKAQAHGSFTSNEWKALKAHYDYRCLCCGKLEPEIKLTVDHVIPLSKGGSNDIGNIQPRCFPCNASKNDNAVDYRRIGNE